MSCNPSCHVHQVSISRLLRPVVMSVVTPNPPPPASSGAERKDEIKSRNDKDDLPRQAGYYTPVLSTCAPLYPGDLDKGCQGKVLAKAQRNSSNLVGVLISHDHHDHRRVECPGRSRHERVSPLAVRRNKSTKLSATSLLAWAHCEPPQPLQPTESTSADLDQASATASHPHDGPSGTSFAPGTDLIRHVICSAATPTPPLKTLVTPKTLASCELQCWHQDGLDTRPPQPCSAIHRTG